MEYVILHYPFYNIHSSFYLSCMNRRRFIQQSAAGASLAFNSASLWAASTLR